MVAICAQVLFIQWVRALNFENISMGFVCLFVKISVSFLSNEQMFRSIFIYETAIIEGKITGYCNRNATVNYTFERFPFKVFFYHKYMKWLEIHWNKSDVNAIDYGRKKSIKWQNLWAFKNKPKTLSISINLNLMQILALRLGKI